MGTGAQQNSADEARREAARYSPAGTCVEASCSLQLQLGNCLQSFPILVAPNGSREMRGNQGQEVGVRRVLLFFEFASCHEALCREALEQCILVMPQLSKNVQSIASFVQKAWSPEQNPCDAWLCLHRKPSVISGKKEEEASAKSKRSVCQVIW